VQNKSIKGDEKKLGVTTTHPLDRAEDEKLQHKARCRSLTSLSLPDLAALAAFTPLPTFLSIPQTAPSSKPLLGRLPAAPLMPRIPF
jgi:hypothetical protein